jgi:hypothetical protein
VGLEAHARIWELRDPIVPFADLADAATLSPHGDHVMFQAGKELIRLDLARPTRTARTPFAAHADELPAWAISDRGDAIVAVPGGVMIWPSDGEPITHPTREPARSVHALADVVLAYSGSEISEWRGARHVATYPAPEVWAPPSTAFDPAAASADGRYVMFAYQGVLLDRVTKIARRLESAWASQAAFSMDSAVLATGYQPSPAAGASKGGRLWRLSTMTSDAIDLPIVGEHAAFALDGRRVVFASSGSLASYERHSGATTLVGSASALTSLAFWSPDHVIGTSMRGTVRIWELSSRSTLDLPGGRVLARRIVDDRLIVVDRYGARTLANPLALDGAAAAAAIRAHRFGFDDRGSDGRVVVQSSVDRP